MTYRTHGLISVIIFYTAAATGLAAIWPRSTTAVIFYIGIIIIGTLGILYSFCAKCPCRANHCSHIVLGWLAKFIPQRKPTPYSFADIAGLLASFLIILVYPQAWLWDRPVMGIIFWALASITAVDILVAVCPDCKNARCPLNRNWGEANR